VTLRATPRVLKRASSLIAATILMAAVLVVGAGPAFAARCQTAGHAYLTQPGRVYFSGYDGDESKGIPQVNTVRGAQFRVGGNGLLPGTFIRFNSLNLDTGQFVDFIPGRQVYQTRGAGTNCVVSEEGPLSVAAPPGRYAIFAAYTSGNLPAGSNDIKNHHIVTLIVS